MVEGERRSAEDIDFDTLADSARDAVAYVESAATIQINYTDPGYDDKDLLSRNKKSPNYEANAEREGLFVQSLNEILDDFLTLSGTVSEMARVNFITFAREEFQGRKGGQLLRNLYKKLFPDLLSLINFSDLYLKTYKHLNVFCFQLIFLLFLKIFF